MLARAIFFGKKGEVKRRYREGQEDQLGALGLVVNAVIIEDGTRLTGPPSPALCVATKADGEACTRSPQPGKDVCWSHDEANAERRRLNSRAGGRAALGPRSPMVGELREIREELRALVGDVRENRVGPQQGSVLVQVYNVMLRCLAEERKAKELDEIEGRLDALEGRTP